MTGSLRAYPPPPMSALRDDIPPPTSYSSAKRTRPASMSDALAVVPPMSRVMRLSNPARAAKCCAPITPAAGPHSTMRAGFSTTASASRMPPLDCITMSRPPMPARSTWDTIERTYRSTGGPT